MAAPDLLDPKTATNNTKPRLSFSTKSITLTPREESEVRLFWPVVEIYIVVDGISLIESSVAGGCHGDEVEDGSGHLCPGGAVPGDGCSSVQGPGAAPREVSDCNHKISSGNTFTSKAVLRN